MRNDLYYYEQKFHERTPAMTYSFLTVGWKWVNEPSKAAEYFRKSYQDYIIQPFKVGKFNLGSSKNHFWQFLRINFDKLLSLNDFRN